MASTRRDHLVETALALFQRHGFHATGIDRILAEAGVAKMTLYHHFRSKDDLILAALQRRDERFRAWFRAAVEGRAASPRARLLAVFEALDEWFRSPDFSGCAFINATAEYGAPDDPVHAAAAEHKRLMRDYLRALSVDAGAPEPAKLADELALLMEGAIVMAHVEGRRDAARKAAAAARVLIDAALA